MIRNIYILLLLSLSFFIVLVDYGVGDTISTEYQEMEFSFCYPADSSGSTFSFVEHTGKVILLDMAASWWGPCFNAIPEGDEIYAHWENDDRVAIIHFLDDINMPYSCTQWGDYGTIGIPSIVDDGTANTVFNWFENPSSAGLGSLIVFFDHTITVANIRSSAPSFNMANAIIGNLLNDVPSEISGCVNLAAVS